MKHLPKIFTAALVVLVIYGIYQSIAEEKDWQVYADGHCKVIGEISASNGVGFGTGINGQSVMTTTYIPGKTGYSCDDGKQYWR